MKSNKNYLPKWDLKELKKLYKSEKNEKAKLRFLCAIHRKQGKSILNISDLLCIPKSTVYDNLNRFKKSSKISAIKDKPKPGRPSKLSKKQIKDLINNIENSPKKFNLETDCWSTSLIRKHINQEFKQKYTMFGVRKLLKKLGFSLQKPRPIHYLGNKTEQEKFKKNFHELSDVSKIKDTNAFFWMKHHS